MLSTSLFQAQSFKCSSSLFHPSFIPLSSLFHPSFIPLSSLFHPSFIPLSSLSPFRSFLFFFRFSFFSFFHFFHSFFIPLISWVSMVFQFGAVEVTIENVMERRTSTKPLVLSKQLNQQNNSIHVTSPMMVMKTIKLQ